MNISTKQNYPSQEMFRGQEELLTIYIFKKYYIECEKNSRVNE